MYIFDIPILMYQFQYLQCELCSMRLSTENSIRMPPSLTLFFSWQKQLTEDCRLWPWSTSFTFLREQCDNRVHRKFCIFLLQSVTRGVGIYYQFKQCWSSELNERNGTKKQIAKLVQTCRWNLEVHKHTNEYSDLILVQSTVTSHFE